MTTTPQELHRWASATGFVLAQGTHQAEEQRENQIKQCSDREQNLQTDIMHRHHAKVVLVVLDSLRGVPIALFFWQETLAGRDAYAWCRFASSVLGRCSRSLHYLIWFSRCSSAWWVPWARTKPVADAHLCNSCGAVIINLLVDRRCVFLFFSFSFDSLWFPARRCDISGTFVVPLVVFVHLNWLAKIKLRGPGPLDQYYCYFLVFTCTVVGEDAKRNWNWRNNRLFCHIFIIDNISIGVAEPLGPSWLRLCHEKHINRVVSSCYCRPIFVI